MLPNEHPNDGMKRILIIEDDEMIASIYKRKFEAAGFSVDVEMDGSQGYYRIFKMLPDAVLLDLLLPGMDGPAIIRKFRAQRKFAELPIIVFTNAYLTEVGREAVMAGATRVFNKATVTPQEIVSAVVGSLNRQIELPVTSQPELQKSEKEETCMLGVVAEPSFSLGPPDASSPRLAEYLVPGDAESEKALLATRQNGNSNQRLEQPTQVAPLPGSQLTSENVLPSAMVANFLQKSGVWIDGLRQALRNLQAEGRRTPKVDGFIDMARIAHAVSSNAGIAGLHYLAHIAAALEAMAWELFDDPSQYAVPTRQTAAKAIDMIARLVDCSSSGNLKEFSRFNALVVDDDDIARKMITKSLDRANLSHVATGRPNLAMELLSENEFDLVILDVQMEGISGFEFCAKMRQMPQHSHCHVIFVSGLRDFQSKLLSTQVGGNEFIVKPFAPMELALKAILHMVASQLDQRVVQETPEGEPEAG